jgi:RNA polymerase sigma-70 factor (sigma-E family)
VSRRRTRDEFDRFVGETADGLLRAASLIVWDVTEAEDLVQECYVRLARRWPRVRAMEHPRAYARRVLVNLALDASGPSRRARTELGMGDDRIAQHADDGAALLFGRVEANTDLLGALGELAPRQRATLVLRYFEDLTEAQVAELMGCSVGTVKSTTARALQHLRRDAGLAARDETPDTTDETAGDTTDTTAVDTTVDTTVDTAVDDTTADTAVDAAHERSVTR